MARSAPDASLPADTDSRADFVEAYRSMFERLPYPMWVYDEETLAFLEVNAAAVAHYGYSRDEFLAMTIRDIRPAEDVAAMQAFARQPARGLEVSREFRHMKKDGTVIHVLVSLHAIRFSGRAARLVLVNDITERVRAEQALRRSEAHLRAIMEHASDAILVLDTGARVLEANAAAVALLDRPRAEIVGRSVAELVDARELAEQPLRLEEVLAGEVVRSDRRIPQRDGSVRYAESSATLLPDGTVLIIARDVTDRRRTEEVLREGEERLRQVLEKIQEVFWMFTPDFGETLYMSPGYERVFGRPLATIYANPRSFVEQVHPDDAAAVEAVIERVREEEIGLEYRIIDPQGRLRWLRSRGGPVRDATGRTYRVAGITEEITAQKEAEIALRQAKEEAEAANRAKNEFLSRTSHELRTPLNAILGFAQLLELELQNPENRESAEQILRAGRHLLTLVDEVLDLAKIEAGELRLSTQEVGVEHAVRRAIELVRPLADRRRVSVRLEDSLRAGHTVCVDEPRLQQVLLNLLSNAIKFNVEGGSVWLGSGAVAGDRVRITVRDTGVGIPAEHLPRIFTPFHRAEADRLGIEGTGLGLSLSKELVEAMNGTIAVESAPGHGSTFSVELPRGSSIAPAGSAEGAAGAGVGAVGSGAGNGERTVLHVEDSVANQRLVERLLQRRPGVRLVPAMQGEVALELARRHRPDLVLLDLDLPDVSGEEVLRQLHADPELRRVPVVVVSADASESVRGRVREMGASDFLVKPIDIPHFLQTLDSWLRPAERDAR